MFKPQQTNPNKDKADSEKCQSTYYGDYFTDKTQI